MTKRDWRTLQGPQGARYGSPGPARSGALGRGTFSLVALLACNPRLLISERRDVRLLLAESELHRSLGWADRREAYPRYTATTTGRSSPRHATTPARRRDRNRPAACLARDLAARQVRIDPASADRRLDGDLLARPPLVTAPHLGLRRPTASFTPGYGMARLQRANAEVPHALSRMVCPLRTP